jgi:hypothetical protein
MAVNLIVLAVTLLVAGFIAVWFCFPPLRSWMEQPKQRFLEGQRRFPAVARDAELPNAVPVGPRR